MQPKLTPVFPPKIPETPEGVKKNLPGNELITCQIPKNLIEKVLKMVHDGKEEGVKQPTLSSPKKRKTSKVKGTWTKEEDELLMGLVAKQGAKKWPSIAQHIKGRNGKQCRERYLNHLDPEINHSEFTKDEDEFIIDYHSKHGNCWAKMSRELSGRPANMIKNRWNTSLSKLAGSEDESPKKSKKRKRKVKKETTTRARGIKSKSKKVKPKVTPSKRKTRSQAKKEDVLDIKKKLKMNISSTPKSKSYFYPLPPSFEFNEINEILTPRTKKILEPAHKYQKIGETGAGLLDLSLNLEEEVDNPFPSPRTFGSRPGGGQTDTNSVDEFYKNLVERNRRINKMKEGDIFNDPSIDEKLGLDNQLKEVKEEKDLIDMGFKKNEDYKSLSLNLGDSAVFASDYGINLGSPSILSLELWSPRFSEIELPDSKKNYLKINVHPTKVV